MALFRFPSYRPLTPYFSTDHHQIFHKTPPLLSSLYKPFSQSNLSFSCCLSYFLSRTHALPIRTNKINRLVLHVSSTTQDPVLESKTQEEEEEEEEENEQEKEEEEEEEYEFSQTRVLAQNVPWTCTPEDIRSLFEKFGTVVDVELSMYNKTRNRGLAFVTMGSPEEAVAAINNLESYEFEGRALKMNYAKVKKKKPSPPVPRKPGPAFNLFVANLPYYAKEKDLKEYFIEQGANVFSAEIIFHDNPRRSSGYGFVAFKTKREADQALYTFKGKKFMGRRLRVARSKQFVRPRKEEALQSDDTSIELDLDSSVEKADDEEGLQSEDASSELDLDSHVYQPQEADNN